MSIQSPEGTEVHVFGLILIFVGVILLLEKLDILSGGFGTYWPVILISFGVSIFVLHQRRRRD
ncbi:MAG: hypothetical protein DSY88_00995 [Candidatus Poseidoniales archaeon]|nr:MAG: hypothetical protein DSY88_00995 [Candidatus Poseidoniales archaeon]